MKPRYNLTVVVALSSSLLVLLGLGSQCIGQNARADDWIQDIPGYPCYRTVEETFTAAEAIVATYPGLAAWIDIGDSWEKIEPGGLGGYDISVLRLTASAVTVVDPKPVLVVVSALHGCDYPGAELAIRWAEFLTEHYGENPDVTWVLDYHEIHLVLISNPDGRKRAEGGLYWRKNANDNYCTGTDFRGADLNRNFSYNWGCCGGSSGSQCDAVYRGPSAASEPETQALEAYLLSILADARPEDPGVPAPDSTSGVLINLSSYGESVVWPWGWTASEAPNGTALQTLGRKLAYLNGYVPSQFVGLYPVDGSLIDFCYGDLGIASFQVALGTEFFQGCQAFEDTILPMHIDMLLAAAKLARAPYLTPSGPEAVDISVGDPESGLVEIAATLDDTRYSDLNGVEPSQAIVAAEYYVDVPPWMAHSFPVGVDMDPADGAFDSPVEMVTTTVDLSSLSEGRHTVFIRGRDAEGNWGAVGATFLEAGAQIPCTPSGVGAKGKLTRVWLSWEICHEPGVDHYVIYRGKSSLPTDSVAAVAHPGSVFVDWGLERGLYFYSVAAVDTMGNSGQYSEQDSAYVMGLSVREVRFGPPMAANGAETGYGPYLAENPAAEDCFRLSPNPARGSCSIYFEAGAAGTFEFGVYDLAGRLVGSFEVRVGKPGPCTIYWDGLDSERRALAPGVYFCRLSGPGISQTRKLVVRR